MTHKPTQPPCRPPAPIQSLKEARDAKALRKLEDQLQKHGAYFDDPAPYVVEPCRVVPLARRGARASGEPEK
jgi:hypothetical protein